VHERFGGTRADGEGACFVEWRGPDCCKTDAQFSESEDAAARALKSLGTAKVRGDAQVDPQVNTFQVNMRCDIRRWRDFGASIMEAGIDDN